MKELITNIQVIFNDVRKGNRVTTFFFLLSAYYIINLLTSPITSGMSGGLEAEHNIFNQLTAGVFVIFVLYYAVVTKANHSYSLIRGLPL